MADEANIPTHRWYQNRNHIKLPMQDVSESVIKAAGIAKIDQFMITAASDALFVAGEVGVWYDPSDLTTLFQDSAGTTPVTAAGQPVGLMLDKSKSLALGAELVTNGGFSVDANWDKGTGWTISGGVATKAAGTASNLGQTVSPSLTAGKSYRVTFGITVTAGSVDFLFTGGSTTFAATGITTTRTVNVLASALGANNYFVFVATAAFAGTIDNISIKELAGNHATQATSAQRPTYGIHPYSGVRNLLLATDTMATQSRTVTAVPHTLSFTGTGTITLTGASTAGPLVGTGAGNRVSLTFTPIAGSLTLTVVGSVTFAQLELGSAATAYQKVVTQYEVTEAGVPSVHYIGFDGVDDGMVTSAIDFSATDAVTVFAGVRKLSDAARATVVELGTNLTGSGRFNVEVPSGALNDFAMLSGGSSFQGAGAVAAAPATRVVAGQAKISTDFIKIRLNGVDAGSGSADQGTGNYNNQPLYIGRRGGSSLPFNGNIYSLIVRGAQSTDSQITNTETWVNGKTGAF